ncbi:MAG: hypothetical protein CL531_02575 [Aestuariibacter sp.]|nr:hypothetical protein [Aestuariibacter sp.]MAP21755.1 hypothetical protein [Alteromonadaceae bacterium]MAX41527.1 hypothetical protein [Alteromonadaceae bacterium]|tara:strand:- start:878 stop:1096 length:219 start_codon:yes stop_codon:yes gene_type:complete
MKTFDAKDAITPIKELTDVLWDYIYSTGSISLSNAQSVVIDTLLKQIQELCDEQIDGESTEKTPEVMARYPV